MQIYFSFTTKIVISFEDSLDNYFSEIFNRVDNQISEGSDWVTASIDSEYVNVSIYSSLSGRSYVKLPYKLKNSKKGFINI